MGVANVPTMSVYIHGDEDEIQEEQRYEKELYNEEKAEESN
jgi:hypothetical protein